MRNIVTIGSLIRIPSVGKTSMIEKFAVSKTARRTEYKPNMDMAMISNKLKVLSTLVYFLFKVGAPMYPDGLVDCGIVVEVEGLKDLLRFARFFSEKYSRKIILFRSGSRVFFAYRRELEESIIGITIVANSRLKKCKKINFYYWKNRVIKKEPRVRLGWQVEIVDTAWREIDDIIDVMEFYQHSNNENFTSRWFKIVDVENFVDLIDYAFYVRDALLCIPVGDVHVFVTGLMSAVFPKKDPVLYLFCSMVGDRLDKYAFIDLSDPPKFVNRIDLRTMRYLPIINVSRMYYYENKDERVVIDSI